MMKAGGTLRRVKVAAARYIAATALCVYFIQEVKTLKVGCKHAKLLSKHFKSLGGLANALLRDQGS
jgi:hypothetical protein